MAGLIHGILKSGFQFFDTLGAFIYELFKNRKIFKNQDCDKTLLNSIGNNNSFSRLKKADIQENFRCKLCDLLVYNLTA